MELAVVEVESDEVAAAMSTPTGERGRKIFERLDEEGLGQESMSVMMSISTCQVGLVARLGLELDIPAIVMVGNVPLFDGS